MSDEPRWEEWQNTEYRIVLEVVVTGYGRSGSIVLMLHCSNLYTFLSFSG